MAGHNRPLDSAFFIPPSSFVLPGALCSKPGGMGVAWGWSGGGLTWIAQGSDIKRLMRLEPIQRAFDTQTRLAHHVVIDLGRGDIPVAEEFLHRPDVRGMLQQVGGEGMSQHMGGDLLVELGLAGPLPDEMLEGDVQPVMPPPQPRARVIHQLPRWPEPLPL